jgi:hypothetical protein
VRLVWRALASDRAARPPLLLAPLQVDRGERPRAGEVMRPLDRLDALLIAFAMTLATLVLAMIELIQSMEITP